MGYSFRLAAKVLLYASSHRQDNTYHGLCYTSRGALAGTNHNNKNNSSSKNINNNDDDDNNNNNDDNDDDNDYNINIVSHKQPSLNFTQSESLVRTSV